MQWQWVYSLSPRKWQVLFVKPKTLVPWPFWQVQLESPCSRKASWVGVIRKPSLQPSLQTPGSADATKIPICEEEHLVGLICLTLLHHDINLWLQGGAKSSSVSSQHPGRRECRLWKSWSLTTPKVTSFAAFLHIESFCCFLQLPDLVAKLPSKGRTLLQALWTLCWCALFHKVSLHHSDFLKKNI